MLKHTKREENNSYFAFLSDVCHGNLRFVHFKIEMSEGGGDQTHVFSRYGVTQSSHVQSIKKSYVSLR